MKTDLEVDANDFATYFEGLIEATHGRIGYLYAEEYIEDELLEL